MGDRKAKAKGMVAAIWNIWWEVPRWQLKDNDRMLSKGLCASSLVNWALSLTCIKNVVPLGFEVLHDIRTLVGSTFHILSQNIPKQVSKAPGTFNYLSGEYLEPRRTT